MSSIWLNIQKEIDALEEINANTTSITYSSCTQICEMIDHHYNVFSCLSNASNAMTNICELIDEIMDDDEEIRGPVYDKIAMLFNYVASINSVVASIIGSMHLTQYHVAHKNLNNLHALFSNQLIRLDISQINFISNSLKHHIRNTIRKIKKNKKYIIEYENQLISPTTQSIYM